MLEVKNLCKTYVTKGNVVTKALDNVSITFPDKGMVFLLGKSGSGKSTLLNVCGGLDFPDSGEVIVKGKSSKDFSKSDFDSYRNTFIGFIFQEYNILNEFTVENNIALALELQGKSKDKDLINDLLKSVDLENYAKRKPNTLSGGQKQRIAIARALIKNPEIIMADEPTGALDSNTGRQVLEALKKLSETKLVIVVSHDREFASIYGDRIIELMDGKVLSDTTKGLTNPLSNGNIVKIDESTLSIPKGRFLNDSEMTFLNEFIKNSNEEIIISNSKQDVAIYKKAARITDNGQKEGFSPTDSSKIEVKDYNLSDTKLIKSKLPLRHAFKIGTSSLKYKPFRLFITIFLSVVSLVLLGMVSTMMFYDKNDVTVETIINSNEEYLNIRKDYLLTQKYDNRSYEQYLNTLLSQSDVESLIDEFSEDTILYYNYVKPSKIGEWQSGSNISITNCRNSESQYYSNMISGFANVKSNNPILNNMNGHYPENSDEIAISSFTADSIIKFGLLADDNSVININSYDDLLNDKYVYLGSKAFKITGIFDVEDYIPQKYKDLKESKGSYNNDSYYWSNERAFGIYSLALVTESFREDNKKIFEGMSYNNNSYYNRYPISYQIDNNMNTNYDLYKKVDFDELYDLNGNVINKKDNDNTISLSMNNYFSILFSRINDDITIYNEMDIYSYNIYGIYLPELTNILNGYDNYGKPISFAERIDAYKKICNIINETNNTALLDIRCNISCVDLNYDETVLVDSFYVDENYYGYYALSTNLFETLYVDSNYNPDYTYETKYTIDENAIYYGAIINVKNNKSKIEKAVNNHYSLMNDDSKYVITNSVLSSIETVNSFVEGATKIILIIGIVIAVFSTILLFNFISVSITNKKKEIGILRAVGARGTDVFKIFFSESFVIVLMCFILSIVGNIIACSVINNEIGKEISNITLFVFGYKSIILLLILSFAILFLSTFLPVYNIARKKPVDSIRAI